MRTSNKIFQLMGNSIIKPKTGPCLDCGRNTSLIAKRCKICYWKFRNAVKEKPKRKIGNPIAPVSKKQKQRVAKYSLVRAEYLYTHPYCEARLCRGARATEIHHLAGKIGDLLTDTDNMIGVCRDCHEWIHLNDAEARDMGLLLSRLKSEA